MNILRDKEFDKFAADFEKLAHIYDEFYEYDKRDECLRSADRCRADAHFFGVARFATGVVVLVILALCIWVICGGLK